MDKAKVMPLLKGVLVLAAIALCSGLLLGFFNVLTYVDPLQATFERFGEDTGAAFSEMTDEEGASYGNGSVIYYAKSDDGRVHAFLAQGSGGYGGSVQLYVYVTDGKIGKIAIGEHSETFLSNLEAAGFYDRFVGQEVASFDASSVDAVSGATKSSTAVKNGVGAVVRYYNEKIAGGEGNGQA